ncbi:MetQ/NlpA family ABC transporter substrate-binding protein [Nesterenkonia sp. NBAIMH1]|uniref:MetQ/NlpA family ABC transporter substrate-binding protein n=1 Tax=Nesterenkonia sp. NBAIMH1 TaxID=2600320 RepID=UPI0011B85EC2|nr:MetQ/NlpA family ABC transporter substrate-binding protein [Nesterenkonia sp. NBAIMH1]
MRADAPSRRPPALAAAAGAAGAASLAVTGCGLIDGDDQTITMVVTENAPFQEPTEIAEQLLEEDGWDVQTTYVTDIIQPNYTVDNGEYDVNFFQNLTYLLQFNEDHDLDLEPILFMFEQPSGIYSQEHSSLEELPDGAQVALPVDTANNGRGISLLARAGLIEVDESKSTPELSVDDIEENPRSLEFIEVDQQSVGTVYDDVDAVFGFARLLAEVDVMPDEALIIENEDEALPFAMTIVAQPGFREQEPEKYQALREAYHSDEVRDWYQEYLDGLLTPAFDRDIDQAWEEANSR